MSETRKIKYFGPEPIINGEKLPYFTGGEEIYFIILSYELDPDRRFGYEYILTVDWNV